MQAASEAGAGKDISPREHRKEHGITDTSMLAQETCFLGFGSPEM